MKVARPENRVAKLSNTYIYTVGFLGKNETVSWNSLDIPSPRSAQGDVTPVSPSSKNTRQ